MPNKYDVTLYPGELVPADARLRAAPIELAIDATLTAQGELAALAVGDLASEVYLYAGEAAPADLRLRFGLVLAGGAGEVAIDATLTGSGSLTADIALEIPGSAVLTGTGAQAADVVEEIPAASALTGSGSLVGDVAAETVADAALTGAGALVADAAVESSIAAVLAGTGSQAGDAAIETVADAALTGTGALAVDTSEEIPADITLTGTGASAVDVGLEVPADAALTGAGALAADPILEVSLSGTATGTGAGTSQLAVIVPPRGGGMGGAYGLIFDKKSGQFKLEPKAAPIVVCRPLVAGCHSGESGALGVISALVPQVAEVAGRQSANLIQLTSLRPWGTQLVRMRGTGEIMGISLVVGQGSAVLTSESAAITLDVEEEDLLLLTLV